MRLSFFLMSCLMVVCVFGQELPLGYISHFETSFAKSVLDKNIILSGNTDYKIVKGKIEMRETNDSILDFKPGATLLIDNNIFGDFITETQVSYQGVSNDSLSGIFFIAGLRDSANYYYVRINDKGTYFNQIYKGEESNINYDSTLAIQKNKLVALRITRDILNRSLVIKYNGSEVTFIDPNLVMGYIGFGVSGYKLNIDKISVWAPTSIATPAKVFR